MASDENTVMDIDLSDTEFWSRSLADREAAFAELRAQPRPRFYAEPDLSEIGFPPGAGYYALVRHADVVEASRNAEVFCSSWGGATNIADMPTEFAQYFGSLINMDDPEHARLRRIVSRAFTPKMTGRIESDVRRIAAGLVDAIAERGECDFVAEVAARLPLIVICDMMGIPSSRHQFVIDRSVRILGGFDPEFLTDPAGIGSRMLGAANELVELVTDLAAHRREHPTEDLVSVLVNADVDGERLTHQEIASFFILLVVAGNETTRNAIAHGLTLLTHNPDQRQLWLADFERHAPTAVEEIVRISSPVIFMRRRATRDHVMNGMRYRRGDKVLLFYWSANRDESVFPDAARFDIRRQPNPQVGFGGPGPHFCLGAHLARREITAAFRELLARLPDISAGEPEPLLGSSFINGIKRLPCEFTPTAARTGARRR
ncbi:cytochrome P450 [Actinophytocola xanthii]|uniref:Cytochrome n=1 Tax=Actinophytocola xanthii TaxID=1912961 RepID=A0A1Q8CNK8_9PSEU|nr:cytochrome P450 [Actinophytocola xanthii]OLF15949.1 cytochrome [Actinophytocola xanthii]